MMHHTLLGLDFGTDSVRAVAIDAHSGTELGSAVSPYKRWAAGRFCAPHLNRFRQHPSDYLESLHEVITTLLASLPPAIAPSIAAIGVDTTGSTPIAVDKSGTALALLPPFADDPDAMFILWKDHTAVVEAEQITAAAKSGPVDYTAFVGGTYSSEWFWAKILHTLRTNAAVREASFSWVEHCDWIPAVLCEQTAPLTLRRSRCAAGHKALWHASWDGLPPDSFWSSIDPRLGGLTKRLFSECDTADKPAGRLSEAWAKRLGLPSGIPVAVGLFDCHAGAIGAQVAPGVLVKVFGTSTCDITVATAQDIGTRPIAGICGQVDGSVVPGVIGLEAGQSAFGDLYSWFRKLVNGPTLAVLDDSPLLSEQQKQAFAAELEQRTLVLLDRAASHLPPSSDAIVALDWINGRRTPNANQRLTLALQGVSLGCDAPTLYRALVEATAFGARAIIECFEQQGVAIDKIVGIGGIAKKSALVMQICADVFNKQIDIIDSEQSCARGAALCAAVAAGLYPSVQQAQQALAPAVAATYRPQAPLRHHYDTLYQAYTQLGAQEEGRHEHHTS